MVSEVLCVINIEIHKIIQTCNQDTNLSLSEIWVWERYQANHLLDDV